MAGSQHFRQQQMFLSPEMLMGMMGGAAGRGSGMTRMMRRYPPPKGEFGAPTERRLYDILKVPVSANESDIRKAYRELSRTKHPDKGGNAKDYQELTNAQTILSDAEKRACYDAYGEDYQQVPNIQLFVQDLRPYDLEIPLYLSTRECIKGKQHILKYQCNILTGPRSNSITVNIPANVPNGHRIVFHGQGNIEPGKALPGHAVVIVLEQPSMDQQYKRIGGPDGMVIFRKKITLADALCGCPITLNLPDESTTTFVHGSVIQPGQWYLLESSTSFPPMYVMFDIIFPDTLSDDKQEKLCEIFGKSKTSSDPHTTSYIKRVSKEDMEGKIQEAQQRCTEEQQQQPGRPGGGGPMVQECRTQ